MALHALGKVIHLLGNLLLVVDTCGTLEQTGVKVEDIARIGLASRRTTKDQRYLAIGNSLL